MPSEIIGLLHPGAMGISVAACALRSGQQVCYASEGRSQATRCPPGMVCVASNSNGVLGD